MRRWVAWSSLLTLLVLTGCVHDSKPKAATRSSTTTGPTAINLVDGMPALAGATQPPGSSLGDGFTVPPTSALVGNVFPAMYQLEKSGALVAGFGSRTFVDGRAWRAVLLVGGDPRNVVRHFQAEAERAGLSYRPQRPWPGSPGPVDSTTANPPAEFCGFEGPWFRCEATAESTNRPERRLSLSIWRFAAYVEPSGRASPRPMSFAIVFYVEIDRSPPRASDRPFSLDLRIAPPPLPDNWPSLPEPGAPVPEVSVRGDRLTVAAGSRVIAPPVLNMDCIQFVSPVVILRIDGDPATVLRSYQRQFVRLLHFDEAPFVAPLERSRDGDSLVLYESVKQGSDYILDLTAFVREGQPTWALLETCLRF